MRAVGRGVAPTPAAPWLVRPHEVGPRRREPAEARRVLVDGQAGVEEEALIKPVANVATVRRRVVAAERVVLVEPLAHAADASRALLPPGDVALSWPAFSVERADCINRRALSA